MKIFILLLNNIKPGSEGYLYLYAFVIYFNYLF